MKANESDFLFISTSGVSKPRDAAIAWSNTFLEPIA